MDKSVNIIIITIQDATYYLDSFSKNEINFIDRIRHIA